MRLQALDPEPTGSQAGIMISVSTHARPRVFDLVYDTVPVHQTFGDVVTCPVCGYPLHSDGPDYQPVVLVVVGPGRGISAAAIPVHLPCSGWTRQQVESGEALQ